MLVAGGVQAVHFVVSGRRMLDAGCWMLTSDAWRRSGAGAVLAGCLQRRCLAAAHPTEDSVKKL